MWCREGEATFCVLVKVSEGEDGIAVASSETKVYDNNATLAVRGLLSEIIGELNYATGKAAICEQIAEKNRFLAVVYDNRRFAAEAIERQKNMGKL